MRRTVLLLVLTAFGLLVFFITREIYRPEVGTARVTSDVLLERIRPVLKLTTVEGDFTELYTYRSADASFDWLNQFSPFQKKAILRVKGRASVGYDLEGLDLSIDERSRTVTLRGVARPRLLALEHDVDYYDLEAGTFTSFTAADHTRINAHAKDLIRNKVERSGLFAAAEAQRDDLVLVLTAMVERGGWHFEDRVTQPILQPAH